MVHSFPCIHGLREMLVISSERETSNPKASHDPKKPQIPCRETSKKNYEPPHLKLQESPSLSIWPDERGYKLAKSSRSLAANPSTVVFIGGS